MKAIELYPAAKADLRDISRRTLSDWGRPQRDAYLAEFRDAFEQLAAFPDMGKNCGDDLADGRVVPVGRHLVYYRVGDTAIQVVRILHQSMDIFRHLG